MEIHNVLTVNDAALLLRVSSYTIVRWLKSGKLHGIKTPGGHWRILQTDLNKLIFPQEIK